MQMNTHLKYSIGIVLFLCLSASIQAQRTRVFTEPEAIFKEGFDFFQKEKYASAQPKFAEFLALKEGVFPGTRAQAGYLDAVCAVELFQADAETKLKHFLKEYPESPLAVKARFRIGILKFREKKFKETLQEFQETDPAQLSREEWYEYKFKSGYAHFMLGQFAKAKPFFAEIKEAKHNYAVPAVYYFAHLAYLDKKYDEALLNFRKIEKEKAFAGMVPYYVVNIYFLQKKYDEVIAYGKSLTDTAKGKNITPVYRLLAEAYYLKNNDERAIEFYSKYLDAGQTLDREGTFKLGRAHYRVMGYAEAADKFASVTGPEDSLAQHAWFNLADCYLKINQERKALDALRMAYKTGADTDLKEDALFNFAKLSFKLDFDPYNEAIKALREYLEAYPGSSRAKEAFGFLAEVFMTTKNYKDALQVLEKIRKNDRRLEEAYHRAAYFHGQDLFNANRYEEALKMFTIASDGNWNNALSAASIFWQGEIYYRQNELPTAAEAYREFTVTPGALESKLLNEAYYNLGYIRFKQANFNQAAGEFRKYIDNYKKGADINRYADACLRTGDAYYVQKDWNMAMTYYEKAIGAATSDADYGLLQKGIILGIQKQNASKIVTLRRLEKDFPKSPYLPEALYEIGNTLFMDGKSAEGITTMKEVITRFPTSAFHKKALLKTGLDYFNRENDDEALAYFKQVLEKYPGSSEASDALKFVRVIYVDAGKADDLIDFLRTVDGADFNEAQMDSTFYSSAENLVIKGDCEKAIADFSKYLSKYPSGVFVINAHYYKGECLYQKGQFEEASADFEKVIEAAPNNFAESAWLRLGEMYFNSKNYARAADMYEALLQTTVLKDNVWLARMRLIRCYAETQNYPKVLSYAEPALSDEKTSETEKEEIYLQMGKAYLANGETGQAEIWLKKASDSRKTEASAEANHLGCKIMYEKGQYTQCEKRILNTVNDMTAYYDWLAKNFILLSDVYLKMDNLDQAIATLQSVVDNHDIPETLELAKQKLAEAQEEQKRRTAKPEPTEFEFEDPGK
jgi:tetratricopeptide (TPR) repeat protein